MKTISRYIMTLALLITAVGGAWAQDAFTAKEITSASQLTSTDDEAYVAACMPNDFLAVDVDVAKAWTGAPTNGSAILIYAIDGDKIKMATFFNGSNKATTGATWSIASFKDQIANSKFYYTADPNAIEVTTDAASKQDLFTTASFKMPTFDADVNYMLVRDMQDEANPVIFSGLPTNDEPIIVKKGDDGKYQPIEALNIQLIDPLAAEDAKNIIAADGITVKVLVGAENELGAIEFDQEPPITLEAFLADMKPGYYWIKAESTDENSPYDGTVYSSHFTVVEKYDLTVKPANDFSKNGLDAVTVGSGSVTIDANTGEATKTGIDPGTEVKIKAKRGYVIDKVEAKKTGPALKTLIVNGKQLNYVEGDTWQQAIERPENAGCGWSVQNNHIFNGGLTLFTKGGGATYVYVKPGNTIDATKNYSLEAD